MLSNSLQKTLHEPEVNGDVLYNPTVYDSRKIIHTSRVGRLLTALKSDDEWLTFPLSTEPHHIECIDMYLILSEIKGRWRADVRRHLLKAVKVTLNGEILFTSYPNDLEVISESGSMIGLKFTLVSKFPIPLHYLSISDRLSISILLERDISKLTVIPINGEEILFKKPELFCKYLYSSFYELENLPRERSFYIQDQRRLSSIGVSLDLNFPLFEISWWCEGGDIESSSLNLDGRDVLLSCPSYITSNASVHEWVVGPGTREVKPHSFNGSLRVSGNVETLVAVTTEIKVLKLTLQPK
jgi:hypothetical protein